MQRLGPPLSDRMKKSWPAPALNAAPLLLALPLLPFAIMNLWRDLSAPMITQWLAIGAVALVGVPGYVCAGRPWRIGVSLAYKAVFLFFVGVPYLFAGLAAGGGTIDREAVVLVAGIIPAALLLIYSACAAWDVWRLVEEQNARAELPSQ